jgi:S-DNA-T family DNA segregation ATPase FtsK/SpoIIIE
VKVHNTNNDVIIINKNKSIDYNISTENIIEERTANTTQEENSKHKKELISIGIQIKIFAILLMFFAVLLFIALITHTSKDEPNIQIKISELFGLFSDDPIIRTKFDTTINAVGLLGAIISNLLINNFIGIWIIGLPVVLFIWGLRLIKNGEIENNIVQCSYTYISVAVFFSCLFGSLSCFETFINIPLFLYGSVGAFIGTMSSNIISPIGSTIVFTFILVLYVFKLIKIKPKKIISKIHNIVDKINIKSFVAFLNKLLVNEKSNSTTIEMKEENIIIEEEPIITNPPIYNEEKRPNIFNETQEQTTNISDILSPNIFNENINNGLQPIVESNINVDDDVLISKFRNKIKLKMIEPDEVDLQNKNNIDTIIDDAIFTFHPPKNIELPKQIIYPKDYFIDKNISDNNKNKNNNLENMINNDITDFISNEPIKIDLSKPKLVIEVDETKKNSTTLRDTNYKSFRNPLSVGMHDEKIDYIPPKLDLLDTANNEYFAADEELQRNGRILQEKLETFKINISNLEVTRGPVVTQYEFVPADGVKINKIEGLADDLAMALKAKSVHIIAPVPEKGTVGIQIPNSNPSIVKFRSVIASLHFAQSRYELPLALGKTVSGEPYIADLTKMPHLLIAGSTGSGKSVGVNTIISSLLYKKHPQQLKFIIIDPKKVELTPYARLSNHFLAVSPDLNTEIVTEPQDAISVLKSAVLEMEKRYTLLEIAKQRNIKDYNEKVRNGALKNDITIDHRELPYIVVIVDELADLMLTAGKEIELPIVRLAQMARAVGIHLIIATQRPSVNIITGIIKANFPSRIAYLVASKIDSRTILDASGAEALLGNGDMLFSAANQVKAIRIQNPFISTDEVERLCDFIGNQIGYSEPYILPSTFEGGSAGDYDVTNFDPLFREAAELIIAQQIASTSMLQRRLKIGFARAGRIIDELASAKVIGPPQGSKPRTVLMENISELEKIFY